MPKVKLGRELLRDPVKERSERTERIIRIRMAEQGIRSGTALAEKANIPKGTYFLHLRKGALTLDELERLHRVLRFSPEDLLVMIDARAKRAV